MGEMYEIRPVDRLIGKYVECDISTNAKIQLQNHNIYNQYRR